MIFLGLASNYSARDVLRHSFSVGSKKDYKNLELALSKRYGTTLENTSLIYSGRSAISLALKSFIESNRLKKGDHVAVNSFTCFAVVEAVKNAGLVPVFLDLPDPKKAPSPDYSPETLAVACEKDKKLKVFILQNTFGLPVDLKKFLEVKKKYNLLLLEDLAHSAGRFYTLNAKKREIGTVGEATCLSFGKGKSIDTITGGAVLLRDPTLSFPKSFNKSALKKRRKSGDVPRASWYPLFGAIARGLAHLKLEKYWLGLLLKLRWIERSADTKLLENTTITNWQAKLALRQLKSLKDKPLREFFLVENREETLKILKKKGIRLEESWYEVPVSPARYYKKTNFPEKENKNAVFFAEHVLNLPTWYYDKKHQKELAYAKKILKENALNGN